MALFAQPALVDVPKKPTRAGGLVAAVPTLQAGDRSRAALGSSKKQSHSGDLAQEG